MQWECSARIGRMLRLKVHFKSRHFDNETHYSVPWRTAGVRSSSIGFYERSGVPPPCAGPAVESLSRALVPSARSS
jgi:hypothetical protein